MGQKDRRQFLVVLRFMFLEPENFACRKARQNRVAQFLDGPVEAAQFLGNLLALLRSGGIAPELGRTNHLTRPVQRDKTVLLTAHSDRLDLTGVCSSLCHSPLNRLTHRLNPICGILLFGSCRQTGDQVVTFTRRGKHFSILDIHHQCLGGLGTTIYSYYQRSHSISSTFLTLVSLLHIVKKS